MAKLIPIKNNSLSYKIEVLGRLYFEELSGVEIDVLCELVRMSNGSGITISADTSKSIKNSLNLNENTFNVALYRLNKKKAIKKDKTLVTLHPVLNIFLSEDEFIIRFSKPEIK